MQELKRPMVLLGYAVLGLAIALWLNYFSSGSVLKLLINYLDILTKFIPVDK